ncbi:MAG: hypothetical protein U5K76_03855 [Woeseiaceae bacterium]|nr:hypothetical protein [Woeseiaceae bacterium]
MTHVICEACAGRDEEVAEDVSNLREIGDFIQSVGRALTAGRIPRIQRGTG